MSDSNDSTLEQDVIDESSSDESPDNTSLESILETRTEFASLNFLMEGDASVNDELVPTADKTDSFDAADNTEENVAIDDNADFDESSNTLEVDED